MVPHSETTGGMPIDGVEFVGWETSACPPIGWNSEGGPEASAEVIDELNAVIGRAVGSGKGTRVAVFPGFFDPHVHLREPGYSSKETIATGTAAAAHGGYTTVGAMPNLDPVPDSVQSLAVEEDLIGRNALIRVIPFGALTRGQHGNELADIAALAPRVIGFSDDGFGVNDDALMRQAFEEVAQAGSIISTHAEVSALRPSGASINDGTYAHEHGLMGIPTAAEYQQIERDVRLLADLKASKGIAPRYNVCHISCRESADAIRRAHALGLDVSAETAPHYLLLDDSMLKDDGRFKMNPPLRQPSDREAIVRALADGTITMIATDHAPHTAEEKSHGLRGSAFGIVGIETAFPLLYTRLVIPGVISLARLVHLFSAGPRQRFGLRASNRDFTLWQLDGSYTIDSRTFLSKGKATPFDGWSVSARCLATVCDGHIAYHIPDGAGVGAF
ncbi:MAG: dihydroorotase [Actinomycetaceae bacterium]|nr:dihydroorotase [Actinomycetaceae bacterium]MDY6083590.1 dihydroorotase [Actinomycetaceae bacterium]